MNDKNLIPDTKDPLKADGINVYVDAENQNLLEPDAGIYKIWCNYKGEIKIYEGYQGQWEEQKQATISCKVKADTNGYQIELALPFSLLKKQTKSDFRINFGLVEYSLGTNYYEEIVINSNATSSNTWLHATFQ